MSKNTVEKAEITVENILVNLHTKTVEFSCKLEIIRKCLRSSTVEIIVLLRSNSTSKIFNVRIQPITVEFRCKAEITRNF